MERPVRWCFLQHFMRNICVACPFSCVSKCWCLYLFVSLFILSCQWYVSWILCSSSSSSWLGGLGRIFGACAGGHGLRDGEPAENMGSLRFETAELSCWSTILSHSLVSEICVKHAPSLKLTTKHLTNGVIGVFVSFWDGANWKVLRELFWSIICYMSRF